MGTKEANMESIKAAQEKFGELIQSEFERIERMKADQEVTDFSKLDKIVVGVLPGDGIGPIIMKEALKVLNNLLAPEIASGHVELRVIEGMTIENRAAKLQSLPDDVFEEIKKCNVNYIFFWLCCFFLMHLATSCYIPIISGYK